MSLCLRVSVVNSQASVVRRPRLSDRERQRNREVISPRRHVLQGVPQSRWVFKVAPVELALEISKRCITGRNAEPSSALRRALKDPPTMVY